MNENLKDEQQVLLVKEKGSDKLGVVADMDEKGNVRALPPQERYESQFLKLDPTGNVLNNFMTNYLRQAKDPTHLGFFTVSLSNIESNAKVISEMLKSGNDGKEFIENYKVNTADFKVPSEQENQPKQKQEYKTVDENKIDWSQLEKMGITRDTLIKTNALDDMLNWKKSNLLNISPKFDDITLYTQARLAFKETNDGKVKLVIHAIQSKPELDRPYYGNSFTDDDKKNLLSSGNLGRIIDLKIQGQEKPVHAFISVDKQTNELISLRTDKIRIPEEIKGVKLTEDQKKDISEGKAVYLENMTAKSGKNFNASVQINADKRAIEFQFGQTPNISKNNNQNNMDNHNIRIPDKIGGVVLSGEDQSLLKEGGIIYVSGMIDKKGQPYNAYIKVNTEKEKLDFFRWNPQKKQDDVTPDNNAKTQVAVNSEGKTNEATKQSAQPLKNGQTEPNQNQKIEFNQKQENKRSIGVRR